jgi:hypothetical protein
MKRDLSLTAIKVTFKEQVDAISQSPDTPSLDQALLLSVRFFENYDIVGVDRRIPDNDMLLFQYGLYDLRDGKGENFQVNFTRQFYIEDPNNDEFYQLGLTLYFEKQFFENVECFSKWSIDFPAIAEWANYIESTQGYQNGKGLIAKSFIIDFGLT